MSCFLGDIVRFHPSKTPFYIVHAEDRPPRHDAGRYPHDEALYLLSQSHGQCEFICYNVTSLNDPYDVFAIVEIRPIHPDFQ